VEAKGRRIRGTNLNEVNIFENGILEAFKAIKRRKVALGKDLRAPL
jgi:hypothetical protein